MAESELPMYRSFEEREQEKCVFCKLDDDDPIELGDKLIYGDITVHQFCAVS